MIYVARLVAYSCCVCLLLAGDGPTGAVAFVVAPVPTSTLRRQTKPIGHAMLAVPRMTRYPYETTSTQLSLSFNEDEEGSKETVDLEQYRHTDFVAQVESVERFEIAEFVGIGIWLTALSTFILLNEFIGPWPENLIKAVPWNVWLVMHYLGGMLFAGGIIMTTCIEWLVASEKDESVLKFWFGKVPVLDAFVVLPGLTMAMIAGTGVSIHHYGGLGKTPAHIETVFWTLVVFALWWALTDLTTQSKAAVAIEQWAAESAENDDESESKDVPGIVMFRRISNVVSCMFIVMLYGIMTLKPGLA